MRTGINVADAMTTQPVTTGKDTSIRDCARLMVKFDVGSMLIKEGNQVAGIVTEYDLTRKVIAEGMDIEGPVEDIMENMLVTISPDKDLSEALTVMNNHEIRHLPVVEDEEFLGFITMKDILKIEPELFETVVEKIRLREESRKPIGEKGTTEGICESCGNYTDMLYEHQGTHVCSECKTEP